MYGVINGLYQCQHARTDALNTRIYARNLPSESLEPAFSPRPVPTKYVTMPVVDCRQKPKIPVQPCYEYSPYSIFNPGDGAPWSGYAMAIDQNSRLKNIFFPNQRCPQSKFIPSTNSELYNYRVLTAPTEIKHHLLFREETFNNFNPNSFDLGKELFNNSTRVQTKNLTL